MSTDDGVTSDKERGIDSKRKDISNSSNHVNIIDYHGEKAADDLKDIVDSLDTRD